jgi:hypothetical protein
MNYLDLLPCDVIKIINRKVKNLHIIERRKERKENKRMQREKKQIADNKKRIYSKFVYLYERQEERRLRKLEEIEEEKYREKINEQHEYLQDLMKRMYDTCTDYILESELCIGGEIPYLTVTFFKNSNGTVYTRKFF